MTQNISRRSVTAGVAWSVPAVAVATAAPALAASSQPPADCYLTEAQLNAGVCNPMSVQPRGAQTYSSTGGGLIDASTANNFGLYASCNYTGVVTAYFYSPLNERSSQVTPPTVTLTDGTTYTGRHTLTQLYSGIAQTAVGGSTTIRWEGSKKSNTKDWNGALVTIPFDWYYTAPDTTKHKCSYALQYTFTDRFSNGVRNMGTPTVIML